MKEIILGTAGHIDHGKTSLIKALSGTDTDRLKEEKLRGITIELGFASLDLPSGQHLGIVDVPGHEKFVKNMVAGATGIDIVMMVIAADEGVMPQTREHMEICSLLGVQHGLVALTKRDMVDEEWLELVLEDVGEFTVGTFLEGAPVLPVSSATGEGLPDLLAALDEISAEVPQHAPSSLFRLPVDRVFSMKGFGTVITGSLVSGQVRVGDNVQLYPGDIAAKVRGIQVHNAAHESATAGMRTAINFQGLEKEAVNRGDVLAFPNSLRSSYMVDLDLTYLESQKKPIKNRVRVRFHTGTSEILGVLVFFDTEEIAPGTRTVAQIRLDEPVALVRGDRYVLRSYSPIRTIGGGTIINPIPVKHKRFRPEVVASLKAISDAEPEDLIAEQLRQAGAAGVRFSDLLLMTNLPEKRLNQQLQLLLSQKAAVMVDKEERACIHKTAFEGLIDDALAQLEHFHTAYPLKPGMSKEELKSKFPQFWEGKLFTLVLNHLLKEGRVVQAEEIVHLADHKVTLAVDQAELKQNIISAYAEAGLTPPYFRDLAKQLQVDIEPAREVLQLLIAEDLIVKVKEDLYYHKDRLETLKAEVSAFLTDHEELSTPQFKDMTGASRKYVIPLLEHFDTTNFTIRIGDIRKLRKR
ncbi:MAG: selenocysteine-specific translation elongation factor [Desulfosarcinaceae bacterium]|nr:selenocysteine-specific translation elongation factor [Desulfosarcinaceae bacterium]